MKEFIWVGPEGVNPDLGQVFKNKKVLLTPAQEELFLRLKYVKEIKSTTTKLDKE